MTHGILKTCLTGIQPTNDLHIGNYISAIEPLVKMQHEFNTIALIADMHALTSGQIGYRDASRNTAAVYLASGLDPEKCFLVKQSDIGHLHSMLSWIFSCFCPRGHLDRMVQMKDKSKKYGDTLGIYEYPVLMAADILLYNPHYVPVGADQKQHIELTKYLAQTMNNKLGKDFFLIPEILQQEETKKIYGLVNTDKKMSKSGAGRDAIFLTDLEETIGEKIKKAKTDEFLFPSHVSELETRKEIANLVNIFSIVSKLSKEEIIRKFAGQNNIDFKIGLSDAVNSFIKPIREKTENYMANPDIIDEVLYKSKTKLIEKYTKRFEEIKSLIF